MVVLVIWFWIIVKYNIGKVLWKVFDIRFFIVEFSYGGLRRLVYEVGE